MSNLKEKIKAAQIDLIQELGIDKLEQEQKEKVITDIGEIIQQRIVMRVVEELPEDKQDDFQGLLEKAQDNPEALDEFIKENIPGIEDMILEEIGEYKQGALEMLGKTQTSQAKEDNQEEVVREKPSEVDQIEQVEESEGQSEVMEDKKEDVEGKLEDEPSSAKATEDKEKIDDNLSGIEQEQIQNEEAILEENKVDHSKVEGEELDLTEELDKMVENDNQEDVKKE